MSLKDKFGTNKSLEREGVWVAVCTNDDGTVCEMKLARMSQSNKDFMRKIAVLGKKRRNKIPSEVPTEKDEDEARKAFVGSILLDWREVIDYRNKNKSRMPFSEENAIWLLKDLPDLYELLTKEAMEMANFQDTVDEEAGKNSFPSSSMPAN